MGATEAAESAKDSDWLERALRLGLMAYGVVHLLIGWLALQLAFGDSSGAASQTGALRTLAEQPLGPVLLWLVAVGFAALVVWQLTEGIWGHTDEDQPKGSLERVGSFGKAVIYAALGFDAAKVATGSGSQSKTDSYTAQVMDLPFGQVLVALVGLGIVVAGGVLVRKGITSGFEDDLDLAALAGRSGTLIEKLGQVGHPAKGLALGIIGALFVWAAIDYDPQKAGGLDVALRTVLQQPFGPALLVVIALGIVAFGLYCFAWARHTNTTS